MDETLRNSLTALRSSLEQLDHTGTTGFEGLIAILLERLTGKHFYIARSGSQHGRDAGSDTIGGFIIAVEAKHYNRRTRLDETELLGKLVEADSSAPYIDIWVLATTAEANEQLVRKLEAEGERRGIHVVIIDSRENGIGRLDALCANCPEEVAQALKPKTDEAKLQQIRSYLSHIAASDEARQLTRGLTEELSVAHAGYVSWSEEQKRCLRECLASRDLSFAHMRQLLNVGDQTAVVIPRIKAWQRLDQWLGEWCDTRDIFALIGEEGDGKSWAVASWIDSRLRENKSFPPILFAPSHKISSDDPCTIIAEAVCAELGRRRPDLWREKMGRWLKRPRTNRPMMILVLDGINEHHEVSRWRNLLANLLVEPYRSSVATIVTCRRAYWHEYFDNSKDSNYVIYELPPYDDEELDLALSRYGLDRREIGPDLLPLLRKPRYLDQTVKHRRRIEDAGDYTPARLVYEDWRDRYERKHDMPISDQSFQDIVAGLAGKHLERSDVVKKHLSSQDINEVLVLVSEKTRVFQELTTGGILRRHGSGQYRVDENSLIYGFGLLLANEVLDASEQDDLKDLIGRWLEPHAEMDIKARICEIAALHALQIEGYSLAKRVALLYSWVTSKNPSPETERNFEAYFPLSPEAYFELATLVWSDLLDNPWVQELIFSALLRWHTTPRLRNVFRTTFEKWSGFVHPSPHPFLGSADEATTERTRRGIAERVGHELRPGLFQLGPYVLTVIEDEGLLRLARVALAVISAGPLEEYGHVIGAACLADQVMGFSAAEDLLSWVIRSAREPAWPIIAREVERLRATSHPLAQRAAYKLLRYVGNEDARRVMKELPENLFPPNPLILEIEKDPCGAIRSWRRENIEECLARADIEAQFAARKLRDLSLDPSFSISVQSKERISTVADSIAPENLWVAMTPTMEQIFLDQVEPALAAFAPDALADLIRRTFGQVVHRNGWPLRQLAVELAKYALVLSETEWHAIYQVWSSLASNYSKLDRLGQETIWFMAPAVLAQLDTTQQLEFILKRPHDAPDFLAYESSFAAPKDWESFRLQLVGAKDNTTLRRLLWFASAASSSIPGEILSQVAPLAEHEDAVIRGCALKIIYLAQSPSAAQQVVRGKWRWSPEPNSVENHWGSLVLSEFGGDLTYSELRKRVHPNWLGYAVARRGLNPDEVGQYAEDIQSIWNMLRTPELASDTPQGIVSVGRPEQQSRDVERCVLAPGHEQRVQFRSQALHWGGRYEVEPTWLLPHELDDIESVDYQRLQALIKVVEKHVQAGNTWFAQSFQSHALRAVFEMRPDLVKKWIGAVSEDNTTASSLLSKARAFYEALCAVLLHLDPEEGIRLYQRLQQHNPAIRFTLRGTDIPVLEYALFSAPLVESVAEIWKRQLDYCRSDQDLQSFMIAAQGGKSAEWIWQQVQQELASDVTFFRARAYMLLGFSDDPRAEATLRHSVATLPDTWLEQVAERALHLWQKNTWAKHWFRQFLEAEDDILAWAAFRLFLRCADRRFWHWKQMAIDQVLERPWNRKRMVFLSHNLETIKRHIRENERDLADRFLDHKLLNRQAWPWL